MAGKEQKDEATYTTGTRLKMAISKPLENIGLVPFKTKIHNESDKPIFLIPISCACNADPISTGKIEKELAIKIKKKNIEPVDCSRYDRSTKEVPSEIHILFRAGSETDDRTKFLEDFCRVGVKLEEGEKLHGHNFLYEECDLYLKLNKEGRVIVDKHAGQDGEKKEKEQANTAESPVTETQMRATLDLIKEIEELKEEVEALKVQMATLKKCLREIGSE